MSGTGWRLRGWAVVFLVFSSLLVFGQFEDSETALRRADTALGQGRFDVALAIYDRVLLENPNLPISAERCRNIADANIRATHQNLKAGVDWLQRAADQVPDDQNTRKKLADALLRNGDNTRAANQYRLLLGKYPDNQQYILGLAVAQRNQGQLDDAATLLASTLKDHPDYKLVRLEYGRNLSYQHDFKGATEQYQQILKDEPDNLQARLGMAKVLSWQGNQEKALVEYDKVLQRDSGNYDALVGEAFSLIWTGRQAEAIPILERANSRHPEDTEVRDALKRLGGVTVLTGEVRAGDVPLPILPPAGRRPTTTRTSSAASEPKSAKPLPPEKTPPQPEPVQDTSQTQSSNTGERRTIWWVVGMGAMIMVGVFAVAGFLLFLVPSMREKREAANQSISNPITDYKKPVEPWVRLEEFSRTPREESPKPQQAIPKPVVPEPDRFPVATPAETLKAALDRSNGTESVPEPSNGDSSSVRGPRRRRGTAERPWWRELPTPDQVTSIIPDKNEGVVPVSTVPGYTLPVKSAAAPSIIDAYDADTVVLPAGAVNPLIPASERPHVEEEPAPSRPFTLVLSRALERAGDGQAQESSLDEVESLPSSTQNESSADADVARPHLQGSEPETEVSPTDAATLKALQGSTAVIVGCGVMVGHYRALLRAAGIDVRLFTFWDLAMTSMRKRRADILIIDGDALDGFTAKQMYTSAQVEKYMFRVLLVGVASDDDKSALPEDARLPHSLSDDDIRARLIDSLAP